MRLRLWAGLGATSLLLVAVTGCRPGSAETNSDLQLQVLDLRGEPHQPLADDGRRCTLLVFLRHDCPIANAYAPELKRIVDEFADEGVASYLVHVDPRATADELQEHAREYGLTGTVLHDRQHQLVRLVGAEVSPQAVVLDPQGTVLYSGRIDDRYPAYGARRKEPHHRDLEEALRAVIEGRPVAVPNTRAIGCYITDLAPAVQQHDHVSEDRDAD